MSDRRPMAPRGPMGPMGGMGNIPPAKAHDFKNSTRRLLSELGPEKKLVGLVLVLISAGVALGTFGPKLLGKATDYIFYGFIGSRLAPNVPKDVLIAGLRQKGQNRFADLISTNEIVPGKGIDYSAVTQILIIVILLFVASSLFMWLQSYIMAGVTQRTVFRLRRKAEEKLGRLPLQYFDTQSRGDLLSRVTNDIDNIATSMQQGLSQILNSVLTVISVLAMMVWISPTLAVVSLVAIPLSILISARIAKRSQKEFTAQWSWTGKLNGHVEEMHTGHALIKVFGRRDRAIKDFSTLNENLYKSSSKAQFVSGMIQPLTTFVSNIIYVAIAVIGGYQVATGTMTLGDVQAFIQYSRQFGMPLAQIAGLINLVQSGVASAERVFELLDAPEQIPDKENLQTLDRASGKIEFRNVSFRYSPDIPLIEDLSITVLPGQTVAIVGPTGAGKTTLVNLIMRFYELTSGQILIDGIDIRDISRDDLRRQFGMVLQDTWLFTGTMRENIAYGADTPSEDRIVEAAMAANIDHLLRALPNGYDSLLTDDNATVSNGERQLLTIARAFIADPAILILDEATSSVDTRTEVLVQQAMNRLRKNRTSFVIAHRLSTIRDADVILVMNKGKIIEQGNHEELMAMKKFYFDLYSSQFLMASE